MELGRWNTVVYEFSDVLAEAAAEVEVGLGAGAEAGEDGGVVGGEGDGEVEEAELAYAGEGVDGPGFLTLEGGLRLVGFERFDGESEWKLDGEMRE